MLCDPKRSRLFVVLISIIIALLNVKLLCFLTTVAEGFGHHYSFYFDYFESDRTTRVCDVHAMSSVQHSILKAVHISGITNSELLSIK